MLKTTISKYRHFSHCVSFPDELILRFLYATNRSTVETEKMLLKYLEKMLSINYLEIPESIEKLYVAE